MQRQDAGIREEQVQIFQRLALRAVSNVGMGFLQSPTYHEERLHLIVVLRGDLVDIEDGRIPARLHATVLFYRLEYSPTVLAVADVSGQPERDK
jgi:hypothetical protein